MNNRMAFALLTLQNLESRRAENNHHTDSDWDVETSLPDESNKDANYVDVQTADVRTTEATFEFTVPADVESMEIESKDVESSFAAADYAEPEASDCSSLVLRTEEQHKHDFGANKSALSYWRNVGSKRQDGAVRTFETCASITATGKHIPKVASSSGFELDCLSSLNTVRNHNRMIQNYVTRQGDVRYKSFRGTESRLQRKTERPLEESGHLKVYDSGSTS